VSLDVKCKLSTDFISFRELVAGVVEEGGAVGGPCPGDSKPSASVSGAFCHNRLGELQCRESCNEVG